MEDKIERVADGLISHFKETIAASAGKPFHETGVSVPHRSIWLGYARAALEASK